MDDNTVVAFTPALGLLGDCGQMIVSGRLVRKGDYLLWYARVNYGLVADALDHRGYNTLQELFAGIRKRYGSKISWTKESRDIDTEGETIAFTPVLSFVRDRWGLTRTTDGRKITFSAELICKGGRLLWYALVDGVLGHEGHDTMQDMLMSVMESYGPNLSWTKAGRAIWRFNK